MEVNFNNTVVELGKKQREVGSEAPAIKIKMTNSEEKVIGMMADKVQAMITVNKDGEVVYKSIVYETSGEFDLASFDTKLDEAVSFKKKGHTHENWMGV